MPKLLTKKGQDATDENYFIGGTVERLLPIGYFGANQPDIKLRCLKNSVYEYGLAPI